MTEDVRGELFYLGMNFNFPDRPNDGAHLAQRIVRALEQKTGDRCTSRWMFAQHHGQKGMGTIIATADLADIARANYVILCPLTKTSRGAHVEMGYALGLDKPTYLYALPDRDPTAFDSLCLKLPADWEIVIENILKTVGFKFP